MATNRQKPKLVAIVGPTASGKSSLALKLAKKFNGEIICADSRTVYKGMNLGTAKPSRDDRKAVPHWGLDLLDPGEAYSAANFKAYAEDKINDILRRDKLPILVGGTGLYIDAVLLDYSLADSASRLKRAFLQTLSPQLLRKIIAHKGYRMPDNNKNKRHLVRAIETKGHLSFRLDKPKPGVLVVGLLPPDSMIKQRIAKRTETIFLHGLIQETQELLWRYGRKKIMRSGGIAYKICIDLIDGKVDQEKAEKRVNTEEWQYARRQKTWFKRHKFIKWFDKEATALKVLNRLLNT